MKNEKSLLRMNIVITGHVDHGKSTLVGRLLADTLALPEGKLEAVKAHCKKNGRVFEYAYLLDALDDEQKQGITIDSARIFFKSAVREYIIIDAPGHIEFLRNMLSGASRAEAAVLVIDAAQGVAENTRRHGLLISLLGISRIIIAVNKLDSCAYSEAVFKQIETEYGSYLAGLGVFPQAFVPVSARAGVNITRKSAEMPWYKGPTLLEALDSLSGFSETQTDSAADTQAEFFAMPVQDIYRFSDDGDERRIYAGTVVSGSVSVGDAVLFLPSGKEAHIKSVETWHTAKKTSVSRDEAVGFTLCEELYVRRGEVMFRAVNTTQDVPGTATILNANVIWLGEKPFEPGKKYLLKIAALKVDAELIKIERFLGGELSGNRIEDNSSMLCRNDCGSVTLKLSSPVVFTSFSLNATLGRFVIVDGYDAAGCGIVISGMDSRTTVKQKIIANDNPPDYAALKKGGFMRQRQKDRFSLRLRVVGGQMNSRQLMKISEAAERFGKGYVHFTSRQGVEIPFVALSDIEAIKAELADGGVEPGVCGPRVRTVTACQGNAVCPSAHIETSKLAGALDSRFYGVELPHKFKFGITGCQNNCLKAEENDMGIKGALKPNWQDESCSFCGVCAAVCPAKTIKIDKEKKELSFNTENCSNCGKCVLSCPENAWKGESCYVLSFGGSFGNEIKTGFSVLPPVFDEESVFCAASAALEFYKKHGKKGERFGKTIARVGIDEFKRFMSENFV
ncbi:MAG: 4Fe-4S binding protein [Spirochaetaceae bacterium]|jgi:bifunctional enzyme CysN/CysC/sulfate adenylyltransferase subunit 1|nr:4Fe-4S binding protein [Spirochaetaceae bacterium]